MSGAHHSTRVVQGCALAIALACHDPGPLPPVFATDPLLPLRTPVHSPAVSPAHSTRNCAVLLPYRSVRRTPLSAGARQQLLDLFAGEAQPSEEDEDDGTAHGIAKGECEGNSSSTGGGGGGGAPRPLTEGELDDDRLYGIIGRCTC